MSAECVPSDVTTKLRQAAAALGFPLFGVAPALPVPGAGVFEAWLAAGHHADMAWLETSRPLRLDPTRVLPQCRSVVVVGLPYPGAPTAPPAAPAAAAGQTAFLSAYARVDDYHLVMRPRLAALGQALVQLAGPATTTRPFVDSAPVLERAYAAAAGLGWLGRNGLIIHPRFGSFFFLGGLLTNAALQTDAEALVPRCGHCRACLDACPTGALVAPGVLDARRCLAYWTIEAATPLPVALRAALGGRLFGCDRCQDVCPWNRRTAPPGSTPFAPRPALAAPRLADLAALGPAAFRRLFAGTPVWRRGLRRLRWTIAALQDAAAAKASAPFDGQPPKSA